MAEKNPPHPPVPDDHGGWPVNQERVTTSGDDLSYEEGLPTLLELVPRRGQPLGMLLTGIAAVALLMAGYRGFGASPPAWVPIPLSAFALEGPGNLASWFSSLVLTAAGLYALVIWWMLHWLYRQRSGVWLLAAICWFFMGMDESSGLHLAMARLLGEFSGSPTNSPSWWLIPYGIVFAGIVSRLVVDLKQSWGALVWMTLAMGAYLLSVIVQAGVNVASPLGWEPVMAEELGELVGHWFLLMANVSFAAYLVRGIFGDDPGRTAETTEGQRAVAAGTETLGRSRRDRSMSNPSVVEEPPENPGDVLIIHPPHGYGPPRAVRRIVRPSKRTVSATKTSRRRSDLDLPTRRTSHKATASPPTSGGSFPASANVRLQSAVKEQDPSETNNRSAAMNAFLAGMAYAEAQKAAQSAAVAPPSSSPLTTELPQAGAMSTMVNPASRAGDVYTAQPTARNLEYTDQLGRVGVTNSRPSSALPPATSSDTGQMAGTRYVAGSNQGHSVSQGNASGQAPTAVQPAIQLPARKLTKEEKKRLKQLYKQRLAQQA